MNLYKIDNTNSIRVWTIDSHYESIVLRHGKLGGTLQTRVHEVIPKGGRSLEQQVTLEVNSRISKQLDKGYKDTVEEAKKGATNQLNLDRPMLAQPIKNVKFMDWDNAFVQFKYDGHRCLITNRGGKIIAYSRNGKIIKSISHITDNIDIPEGYTLDGELYCHGESLQTIGSWIKRNQPDSEKLMYHVYDSLIDIPYEERYAFLHTLNMPGCVILIPTNPITSMDSVPQLFTAAKSQGYEGLIIRQGEYGYEPNKRSKSLVKVKQFLDDEFVVVDIIPSREGWGILKCLTKDNKSFRTPVPGNIIAKKYALDKKELFIGKSIRVEYANLTADGIPFHPVAIGWRDKGEE